jgi:hypothetical protein
MQSRRSFLATMAGAALLPLAIPSGGEGAVRPPGVTPINFIRPKGYAPPAPAEHAAFGFRLTRATLEFMQEHYRGKTLPLWGRKFEEIDLEKRVRNIVYWVLLGVHEHRRIHPVDPVWIVAQIMAESFFHEFAISSAFAVGVCQFVPETAQGYGIRLFDPATTLKIRNPEVALSLAEHRRLRGELRAVRQEYRTFCADQGDQLKTVLTAMIAGKMMPDAEQHLSYLIAQEELEARIKEAQQGYIAFLRANFEGRSIFNKSDLIFLSEFDERVTYRKPVMSMVEMMAGALKARSGNILAAASAYNAGLSTTRDSGLYEPFGRIPNISETSTYVSRILVNHHQIAARMG